MKTVYVCGVDWQHEIGETQVTVFASVKSLKKSKDCTKTCGIVKLKVELEEWVEAQNLGDVADEF